MNEVKQVSRLRRASGQFYQDFLADMHETLKPEWYLEIGTQSGKSLALSKARSVSVDPVFVLKGDVTSGRPETHFFEQTSDDFFASGALKRLGVKFDLAFLDGMHLYEFLLRDFINSEPHMQKGGHVVLHDCMPWNAGMAARDRRQSPTRAWTGDVWKVVPILQKYRPDLKIQMFNAEPTGLVVVSGLNPKSRVLAKAYDEIIKEWDGIDDVEGIVSEFEILPTTSSPWSPRVAARAAGKLSFAIQSPVPRPRVQHKWGDHHFATGLAEALKRQGHDARVQTRKHWHVVQNEDEIDLVIRGRAAYGKRAGRPVMYWMISSHGDRIEEELSAVDHIFAAGQPLVDTLGAQYGADRVSLLPQAFDTDRIPLPDPDVNRDGLLFVGIPRSFQRPMIGHALATDTAIDLWGGGWEDTPAGKWAKGGRIENEDLASHYTRAAAVLNDHTSMMANTGLPSNRIFDALACAAPVISDPVAWMPEDIAEFVEVVGTDEEFLKAVRKVQNETKKRQAERLVFAHEMRKTHSFDARATEIIAKARSLTGIVAQ